MNRSTAAMAMVLATSGIFTTVALESAQAVGGTCSSVRQKDERFGPDYYRVRASCSSLNGDSKARGILDKNGVDQRTQFFTTLNKYYYSSWVDCLSGCKNTRVEIAHV